jgi:hypothetical protein
MTPITPSSKVLIIELSRMSKQSGAVDDLSFRRVTSAIEGQLIKLKNDINYAEGKEIKRDIDDLRTVSKKFIKLCKNCDFTSEQLKTITNLKTKVLDIKEPAPKGLLKLNKYFNAASEHALIRTNLNHQVDSHNNELGNPVASAVKNIDESIKIKQDEAKNQVEEADKKYKKKKRSDLIATTAIVTAGAGFLIGTILAGVFFPPSLFATIPALIMILIVFSKSGGSLPEKDPGYKNFIPTQEIADIKKLESYKTSLEDPKFQNFLEEIKKKSGEDRLAKVIDALKNPDKVEYVCKAFEAYNRWSNDATNPGRQSKDYKQMNKFLEEAIDEQYVELENM